MSLKHDLFQSNFLKARKKLWYFQSADAEALRKRKIVVIFKEKLDMEELIPELRTYVKLRLSIQPDPNIDKLAARIRYENI